jgi:hypothetical protein
MVTCRWKIASSSPLKQIATACDTDTVSAHESSWQILLPVATKLHCKRDQGAAAPDDTVVPKTLNPLDPITWARRRGLQLQ